MLKVRFAVSLAALMAVSLVRAQDAPGMDPDACAKHCQEMKASHQKAMDARASAWKDIEAQLEIARNARGDQKVAALESAVQKLVALQAAAPAAMAGCPMMAGMAHGKAGSAGGGGCCGGATKGCCGKAGAPADHHCAM